VVISPSNINNYREKEQGKYRMHLLQIFHWTLEELLFFQFLTTLSITEIFTIEV